MADAFASHQDYAVRTGETLSTSEQARITTLLADASALIRQAVPNVDAYIASNDLDLLLVTGLCVRVTHRYVVNPTQAAALTTGPFTSSWAAANTKGMYVSQEEAAGLVPPPAVPSVGGVGSIRVGLPVGVARPVCPPLGGEFQSWR